MRHAANDDGPGEPDAHATAPAPPDTRRRLAFGLVLLFLGALAIRAAHAVALLRSPIGDTLVQDALHYHERALRLLGLLPGVEDAGPSFLNVGYPYLLALVYAVAGPAPAAAIGVQVLLGALTCVLLALAVRRLLDDPLAGGLAGLLYAVYDGAVFYDALLLTPAWTNLLLSATALALAEHASRRRRWPIVAGGVALALATLARANLLPLVPLLGLAVFLHGDEARPRRRDARGAAVLVGVVAAVLAPWILYPALAHRAWVPLTTSGGVNFWIGNNRQAGGIYYAAEFLERRDAEGERLGYLTEARRRTGDPGLTLAGSSAFWLREGLAEAAAHPGRWLRLQARKLALFWNAFETKTNVALGFHRLLSPVLAFLPLGFGPLVVLGLAGLPLLVARGRALAVWLVAGWLLVPLATCVVFFVSGEYRHPASLALCVTAALSLQVAARALRAGVARLRGGLLPGLVRRPGARGVLAGIVLGALALPLVFRPIPDLERACHPRLDYANYAFALGAGNEPEGLRRALDLLAAVPASLRDDLVIREARLRLATRAAAATGEPGHARDAASTARGLLLSDLRPPQPDYPERFLRRVHRSLESALATLERLAAVRQDPQLRAEVTLLGANAYDEIMSAHFREDYELAVRYADAALERAPQHAGLLARKGRALLASGLEREGLECLRRSLDGWPPSAEPAYYLAEHHLRGGDLAAARTALAEALARQPDHAASLQLRGRLSATPDPPGEGPG